MSNWQLNPELSAKDNLWDAIDKCARTLLNKKKLRLTTSERHDLLMDIELATYQRVIKALPTMNKDYSLYNFVYWHCWSVSGNETTKFLNEVKQRLNNVPMHGLIDDALSMEETLADTGAVHYISKTDASIWRSAQQRRKKGMRRQPNKSAETDYEIYQECCIDCGMEPLSREEYKKMACN